MLLLKNKKALFNNEILEKYVAGIVLTGYEVKALRAKNANFEGSFVSIYGNEIVLKHLHIGKYANQSQDYNEQTALRDRKLLLNKNEISQIQKEVSEKGKTAVPLAFLLVNGKIKLEFAVVKGRKKHEKRQLLKKRQIEADLEKLKKSIRP